MHMGSRTSKSTWQLQQRRSWPGAGLAGPQQQRSLPVPPAATEHPRGLDHMACCAPVQRQCSIRVIDKRSDVLRHQSRYWFRSKCHAGLKQELVCRDAQVDIEFLITTLVSEQVHQAGDRQGKWCTGTSQVNIGLLACNRRHQVTSLVRSNSCQPAASWCMHATRQHETGMVGQQFENSM